MKFFKIYKLAKHALAQKCIEAFKGNVDREKAAEIFESIISMIDRDGNLAEADNSASCNYEIDIQLDHETNEAIKKFFESVDFEIVFFILERLGLQDKKVKFLNLSCGFSIFKYLLLNHAPQNCARVSDAELSSDQKPFLLANLNLSPESFFYVFKKKEPWFTKKTILHRLALPNNKSYRGCSLLISEENFRFIIDNVFALLSGEQLYTLCSMVDTENNSILHNPIYLNDVSFLRILMSKCSNEQVIHLLSLRNDLYDTICLAHIKQPEYIKLRIDQCAEDEKVNFLEECIGAYYSPAFVMIFLSLSKRNQLDMLEALSNKDLHMIQQFLAIDEIRIYINNHFSIEEKIKILTYKNQEDEPLLNSVNSFYLLEWLNTKEIRVEHLRQLSLIEMWFGFTRIKAVKVVMEKYISVFTYLFKTVTNKEYDELLDLNCGQDTTILDYINFCTVLINLDEKFVEEIFKLTRFQEEKIQVTLLSHFIKCVESAKYNKKTELVKLLISRITLMLSVLPQSWWSFANKFIKRIDSLPSEIIRCFLRNADDTKNCIFLNAQSKGEFSVTASLYLLSRLTTKDRIAVLSEKNLYVYNRTLIPARAKLEQTTGLKTHEATEIIHDDWFCNISSIDFSSLQPMLYSAPSIHLAKYFISKFSEPILIEALLNLVDSKNNTPLHHWIKTDNQEAIKALLERIDIDTFNTILFKENAGGKTPLEFIQSLEIARMIVQKYTHREEQINTNLREELFDKSIQINNHYLYVAFFELFTKNELLQFHHKEVDFPPCDTPEKIAVFQNYLDNRLRSLSLLPTPESDIDILPVELQDKVMINLISAHGDKGVNLLIYTLKMRLAHYNKRKLSELNAEDQIQLQNLNNQIDMLNKYRLELIRLIQKNALESLPESEEALKEWALSLLIEHNPFPLANITPYTDLNSILSMVIYDTIGCIQVYSKRNGIDDTIQALSHVNFRRNFNYSAILFRILQPIQKDFIRFLATESYDNIGYLLNDKEFCSWFSKILENNDALSNCIKQFISLKLSTELLNLFAKSRFLSIIYFLKAEIYDESYLSIALRKNIDISVINFSNKSCIDLFEVGFNNENILNIFSYDQIKNLLSNFDVTDTDELKYILKLKDKNNVSVLESLIKNNDQRIIEILNAVDLSDCIEFLSIAVSNNEECCLAYSSIFFDIVMNLNKTRRDELLESKLFNSDEIKYRIIKSFIQNLDHHYVFLCISFFELDKYQSLFNAFHTFDNHKILCDFYNELLMDDRKLLVFNNLEKLNSVQSSQLIDLLLNTKVIEQFTDAQLSDIACVQNRLVIERLISVVSIEQFNYLIEHQSFNQKIFKDWLNDQSNDLIKTIYEACSSEARKVLIACWNDQKKIDFILNYHASIVLKQSSRLDSKSLNNMFENVLQAVSIEELKKAYSNGNIIKGSINKDNGLILKDLSKRLSIQTQIQLLREQKKQNRRNWFHVRNKKSVISKRDVRGKSETVQAYARLMNYSARYLNGVDRYTKSNQYNNPIQETDFLNSEKRLFKRKQLVVQFFRQELFKDDVSVHRIQELSEKLSQPEYKFLSKKHYGLGSSNQTRSLQKIRNMIKIALAQHQFSGNYNPTTESEFINESLDKRVGRLPLSQSRNVRFFKAYHAQSELQSGADTNFQAR